MYFDSLFRSQSHAVSYKTCHWDVNEVLILPSLLGQGLVSLDEANEANDLDRELQRLHLQHVKYALDRVWGSVLLLIPIQIKRQHALLVVTNARLAISQSDPARCVHEVLPGHSKPDRMPFAVLFLTSAPFTKAKEEIRLSSVIRRYLALLWRWYRGSDLEFVDWLSVKVRLISPEACTSPIDVTYPKSPRHDVISESGLYLVHNAEAIMRPGAADRVRQAGQVRHFDSRRLATKY